VIPLSDRAQEDGTILQRGVPETKLLAEESKRMRSKLALSFFALSGLALLLVASLANGAMQDRDDDRDSVREMTGCLQKDAGEYELIADNGRPGNSRVKIAAWQTMWAKPYE
jgi:hypothetical protein